MPIYTIKKNGKKIAETDRRQTYKLVWMRYNLEYNIDIGAKFGGNDAFIDAKEYNDIVDRALSLEDDIVYTKLILESRFFTRSCPAVKIAGFMYPSGYYRRELVKYRSIKLTQE